MARNSPWSDGTRASASRYFRLFVTWQGVDDAYFDQVVDRVLAAFGTREAGPQKRTTSRAL